MKKISSIAIIANNGFAHFVKVFAFVQDVLDKTP
jgi:hypothetical protein